MNQTAKLFIFVGPPGAGKGSLSNLCVKHFGWLQISTGNLCRKHIAEQTKIGKEIDLIIKSGRLISDELVTNMVTEWFSEHVDKAAGIILDGYPRTVIQAQSFDSMIQMMFPTVHTHIVLFSISDDTVVERLCCRFVCQNKDCQAVYSAAPNSDLASKNGAICDQCGGKLGRREDDAEVSVRKRLEIYHKHEQELISFYRNNGDEIIELNAEMPLKDVFENFVRSISE